MSESLSSHLSQQSIMHRERPLFEGWVKRVMPMCWPNPDDGGQFVFPPTSEFAGQYFNRMTNYMWLSWLARALVTARDGEAK